ncbi:MAG: intein-containing replicative DNA helicase, partial [Gemmatimonadetes bacterium]|nr:intein-containing replicative DNA helicase [Gemmatimonadota bacterium]
MTQGPPQDSGPPPHSERGNGRDQPRGSGPAGGPGLGRVPPQAVEVEQAVIGAMLLDGRAVGRAIEMLDEGIFYNAPHAHIYNAMVSLYERSEPVDQLTVAEELKAAGRLDEAGGV